MGIFGHERLQQRLDLIFEGWREGKTAQEIFDTLERQRRRRNGERANRRGRQSETRFDQAVSQLPLVKEIQLVKRNSGEDWHLKVDRWVICEIEGFGRLVVAVQVKSSERGIENFLKTYVDPDEEMARKRLTEFGMVIVNGQERARDLREDFSEQIYRIVEAVVARRQRP